MSRILLLLPLTLVLIPAPSPAQIDLTGGTWMARYHEDQPERVPGPEIGDYLGLPITDAARQRADNWMATLMTLPEWQCRPHPPDYSPNHSHVRFWLEKDNLTGKLIAIHSVREWQTVERTIWMDGRPHPPDEAMHTWQGFSTGEFNGATLVVTTTHLKNSYIRRNGVPRSARAKLVEHYLRHGDLLTIVSIVDDPVYLTEPMIRSRDYVLDPTYQMPPYPCEAVEEIPRPQGYVPHYLPGTNPFLTEFAENHQLPAEAARGGAETMYPEYMNKLKTMPAAKKLQGAATAVKR